MDRALKIWVQCKRLLRRLGSQRKRTRQRYSDSTVLLIDMWATLRNQPVKWACRPAHWPGKLPPGGLPSPSAFSRRISMPRVLTLRRHLEEMIARIDPLPTDRVVTLIADGHAIPVARHSRDRDAKFGRGAGGPAKGYKVHPLRDYESRIVDWRLSSMNTDEGEMLRRLIRRLPDETRGYVLADASYDDNWLFGAARSRGLQLVVPRRRPGTGFGHRRHDPARVRCQHLLESPITPRIDPSYGQRLYDKRSGIERQFGH